MKLFGDDILGQNIVEIKPMDHEEMTEEDWDSGTIVLVLKNGVKLYASRDEEGNDAGCMFGKKPNGERFAL